LWAHGDERLQLRLSLIVARDKAGDTAAVERSLAEVEEREVRVARVLKRSALVSSVTGEVVTQLTCVRFSKPSAQMTSTKASIES
jgi:hypothetical protein